MIVNAYTKCTNKENFRTILNIAIKAGKRVTLQMMEAWPDRKIIALENKRIRVLSEPDRTYPTRYVNEALMAAVVGDCEVVVKDLKEIRFNENGSVTTK